MSLSPGQLRVVSQFAFTDVTNRNYGTEAVRGSPHGSEEFNSIIIKKGTTIPSTETRSYYTGGADQRYVDCSITQCEYEVEALDFVDMIHDDYAPLPQLRGGRPSESEIVATYSYDVNQIMHCTFVDEVTGEVIFELKVDFNEGS